MVTHLNFLKSIRFKTGNSCYYSVETLLSSRLHSINLKIKIYKTIILPVVLYGCETWSLTLREECRLMVFENRTLRLHNEELHSLYRSFNIVRAIKSRRLRWAGHIGRMEDVRSVFKIWTGKAAGKRPLGRPRRRSKDNIRMDHKEIGISLGNWVDLAQESYYWRALVNVAVG